MDKLNPIKYIENMMSHHPKSFFLWITEGIVIDGKRYIIKEFRLRDGKLYAVIAEDKYKHKYFEVQLCPDEETLKDIYQAIKENKIAIEKEVTDRNNEINRVDNKITELQGNIKPIVSGNTELLTVTNEESQIKLTPSHDVQKEQVLESTRNTVNIQHGSNGTTEETTVDTNPQKVLEHENLVSDSEYVTINHQTGENTTHIQTTGLEDTLHELYEIISSIGGGGNTTHTAELYPVQTNWDYRGYKQVVTYGYTKLVIFTFDCGPAYIEREVTGDIQGDLEKFVRSGMTVTNGAISITNDGTHMKLIKSGASDVYQQGTFIFFDGVIIS